MAAGGGTKNEMTWWRYWPCALAGLGVPLAVVLTRWVQPYFAVGISFFVTWLVIALLLMSNFTPKRGIPIWVAALASAFASALAGGLIAYFIRWP